jgi:hypothetical protein
MEIKIVRKWKTDSSTLSVLWVDGNIGGFVLEDADRALSDGQTEAQIRAKKIAGQTAIPAGRYRIENTYSNRWRGRLPLLVGVKGFTGIRIHPGNTVENTEGCLLPGMAWYHDGSAYKLLRSVAAFEPLHKKISEAAARGEEIWIEIQADYSPTPPFKSKK